MARKAGSLNWGTLARWSNQEIYEHFINTKKYTPQHAFWSVRKLRQNFDMDGKRRAQEQHLPSNFWTPLPVSTETPAPVPPPPALEETPSEACENLVESAPESEQDSNEDMAKKDNATDALAALLAPALTGMVSTEIEKAVKKIHENLAPVKQLVVVKDKLEIDLGTQNHAAAPKVLQLVNQGLNVMLVGPAGCGKTMLAETVAKALNRPFTLVSCSAGMSEAQLLGRLLPLGAGGAFTYVESPFMRAYASGGVILLDEMDAADANLLLVINAALANGGITVEARAALGADAATYVKRHPDTVVIAAANTWGSGADTQYIGRGALDVSTLDRFYRLALDYDEQLEASLGNERTVAWVQNVRKKATAAKLRRVMSTRAITRIERALAAGMTFAEATTDELSSWTPDERSKVA